LEVKPNLERSLVSDSTHMSYLACKYQTWVEVTDSGKHSSLLQYRVNTNATSFTEQAPGTFYSRNLQIFVIS